MEKKIATLLMAMLILVPVILKAQSNACLYVRYPFNYSAKDTSGNGLNATDSNITHVDDRFGQPGRAFYFNGKSVVYSSYFSTDSFKTVTVTGWFKTSSAAYQSTLFQLPSWVAFISRFGTGKVLTAFDGSTANNSSSNDSKTYVNNGLWYHFAASNNGDTTKIYINGVLENKYPEKIAHNSHTQLVVGNTIGRTFAINATIDEVRVYKCALTDAEVKEVYNDSSDFIRPDAGMKSIDSLTSVYCGKGSRKVYVRIRNYSSLKNLDSVRLGWSVNGVLQPFVSYKSSVLKPGAISGSIFLGSASFSIGNNSIKVWTYKPNGGKDANTGNDTMSMSILVRSLPSVSFTAANACAGESISFTNNTTSADSIATYLWKFGDGTTSSVSGPIKAYSSSGTYSVRLIATTVNGCSDSFDQNVTVYARPKAGFTARSTCGDSSVTFSNTSSISSGQIIFYAWSFGDGSSSTAVSPVHKYASPGNYSVYLVITSNNGCADSVRHSISVYPAPKAGFTATNSCDSAVSFKNTTTPVSGYTLSYSWDFGDNGFSTQASPTHTYNASGEYTVWLKVITNKGCADSVSSKVIIYPHPKASFSASNNCLGKASTFINTSSIDNPSSLKSFLWSFGDGVMDTVKNPSHTYSIHGTYTVSLQVTSKDGCQDSFSKKISIFNIPSGRFTSTINKRVVQFEPIDTSGASYSWDFGDDNTSFLKSPKHTYATDSTYKVSLRVVNKDGCDSTYSTSITVKGTGIQWIDGAGIKLIVYPNPVKNELNIRCMEEDCSKAFTLTLYDMLGRKVKEARIIAGDRFSLPMTDLKKGPYLIKISDGYKQMIQQIIKE